MIRAWATALVTRRRGAILTAALAMALGAAVAAGASPTANPGASRVASSVGSTVMAGATGASTNLPLVSTLLPPGVSGTASSPASGFGPLVSSAALVGLPAVIAAAEVEVSASGATGPDRLAQASAAVQGLQVLAGLISASSVSSNCQAGASGPTASVNLDALVLAGLTVPLDPAPNTTVSVPGVLTAVLNEQVPTTSAGERSLLVRAADIRLLNPDAGGVITVVLAESRCMAIGTGPLPGPSPHPRHFPAGQLAAPATSAPAPSPPPSPVPSVAPPPRLVVPTPSSPPAASLGEQPRSGPAGAEISLSAPSGFGSCPQVGIFFDGTQIGSVRPDRAGGFAVRGLSVPGSAAPGGHSLVASCLSGKRTRASTSFRVVATHLHRSSFVTSVPNPSQVATGLRAIAGSALLTVGLVLLIAFPGELFNSTLDENYDEVRGWFGLGPKVPKVTSAVVTALSFAGFILLGGVLYALLAPDSRLDLSTLALVLGFALALAAISFLYRLPFVVSLWRSGGERARLKVLPGTVLIALACVVVSRALHFEPGYFYGLIAGLEFGEVPRDTKGRLTSAGAVAMLLAGLLAWVLKAPVGEVAARTNAFWAVTAEAALAALFVMALETLVFAFIPLRFLEGSKVTAWSRAVWAAIFAIGLFAFIHVLLRPGTGYVSDTHSTPEVVVVALFLGFGLFSVAFWAYFRFRPASWAPGPKRQPAASATSYRPPPTTSYRPPSTGTYRPPPPGTYRPPPGGPF